MNNLVHVLCIARWFVLWIQFGILCLEVRFQGVDYQQGYSVSAGPDS